MRSTDKLDAIDDVLATIDSALLEANQVSLAVKVEDLLQCAAPRLNRAEDCSDYCSCPHHIHDEMRDCRWCECRQFEYWQLEPEKLDLPIEWTPNPKYDHASRYRSLSPLWKDTAANVDALAYEVSIGLHLGRREHYVDPPMVCRCGDPRCEHWAGTPHPEIRKAWPDDEIEPF